MSGFFDDDELKNENADRPWMKSETDRMLDLYFDGSHPKEIAQKLKRNPKAVKRKLEQFTYNERERAVRYEPFRRVSRIGKRWTENERVMLKIYQSRNFPLDALARVLQRSDTEMAPHDEKVIAQRAEMKIFLQPGIGVDMVLAHYAVKEFFKKPNYLIPEVQLKKMEEEEVEFGVGREKLLGDRPNPPPHRVRQLALYLMYRQWEIDEGKEIF